MNRLAPAAIALLTLLPAYCQAQDAPAKAVAKTARPSIYDAKADAREAVKVAAARAKSDGKRVLVMFGGDWCGWCHKLHGLFQSDPAIRTVLRDEYVTVMVDTKAPHAEALLDECKGDLTGVGYPFLAVLDGGGKVVTRQKTDPLEEGDHHDPAKVKAFLDQWASPKLDAEKVVADALDRAKSQDKVVLLHFGAPWCGWCHKLEDFLAMEDVSTILGKDFVEVKVDVDRMDRGKEVLSRYRKGENGGIPWMVFLDADGKTLATSDGPKGNIGYPATPEEIDHFLGMIRKAAKKIEPAQVEAIQAKLKAEAEKIEAARNARAAKKVD